MIRRILASKIGDDAAGLVMHYAGGRSVLARCDLCAECVLEGHWTVAVRAHEPFRFQVVADGVEVCTPRGQRFCPVAPRAYSNDVLDLRGVRGQAIAARTPTLLRVGRLQYQNTPCTMVQRAPFTRLGTRCVCMRCVLLPRAALRRWRGVRDGAIHPLFYLP